MAASDPNTVAYFVRAGTVLPPYVRASARHTNTGAYFMRGGTVMFPAMIQVPNSGNFFLLLGG